MNYPNVIQFELSGRYALFTDPLTKSSGEKCTLPVPTYEALKGAARSIYSSRSFCWVIDSVRIMQPIVTESIAITRTGYFENFTDISIYTFLKDVRYKVLAHLEFPDGTPPETQHKYYAIARRMLKAGGKREVFLGVRSCIAEVRPCRFNTEMSAYDGHSQYFGLMHHSFTYPTADSPRFSQQLFYCEMNNGIITFPPPAACPINRRINTANKYALV
ncbi:MAG: type I-C CRISPR-associated protein Cas5 [Ruminococcaceae bacterium]|nr:type I-C CRISPR-associated protein Cas5 [Oscillospiraceae bacterium]